MRRGTQEDAEEFLGFFLETLSEEVSEIVRKEEERIAKLSGGGKDKGKEKELVVEEEGWEEVGSKGRTATTRTVRLPFSLFLVVCRKKKGGADKGESVYRREKRKNHRLRGFSEEN